MLKNVEKFFRETIFYNDTLKKLIVYSTMKLQ